MSDYQIKFTKYAHKDIEEIFDYIANTLKVPDTAMKLIDELEAAVNTLASMPLRCAERKIGAYAGKGYRQLFVKNFTVIFRVDEASKQVIIVTVRYSRSSF